MDSYFLQQSELYSQLMGPWQQAVGWIAMAGILLLLWTGFRRDRYLRRVLMLAWLLRIIFAIYNTYFHTFATDDFEDVAAYDSSFGYAYVAQNFNGGADLYRWFCGLVYCAFGRTPLLLEALNIGTAVLTVALVYRLTTEAFGQRAARRAAIIAAVFPATIFLSTSIVRESFWIIFGTLGVYWWVIGLKRDRIGYVLAAPLPMMVAYGLHIGAIGMLAGWASTPLIKLRCGESRGVRKVVIATVLVLTMAIVGFGLFRTDLLNKLNDRTNYSNVNAATINTELQDASRDRAAYLSDMNISSASDIIWEGPIRFVYFIGMPFPWRISRWMDVAGFLDAGFYMLVIGIIAREWRWLRKREVPLALISVCVITWAVFAFGTGNYGTAIRHRGKMLPVAACLGAGCLEVGRSKRQRRRRLGRGAGEEAWIQEERVSL